MEKTQIAVVGGGPAGIAVAVEAKSVGIDSVIILEKTEQACDTIVSLYHEGKRVDPVYRKVKVDPIGELSFVTESREAFLERMDKVLIKHNIDVRYRQECLKIVQHGDLFHLRTGSGMEIEASIVVVAIGVFGKPVKPFYPIPKEIRDKVYYSLPKQLPQNKNILVIGGGDTAAELACFLSEDNNVLLSYRRSEFFRVNETNICNLDKCYCCGTIALKMGTDIVALEPEGERILVIFKDDEARSFDALFYCLGGATPQTFLEGIGVNFRGKKPEVDVLGKTHIPRLFLVGDLVADKGSILAAFNSAARAMEGIGLLLKKTEQVN
jgi:thioredoxin reductase (NADPH)